MKRIISFFLSIYMFFFGWLMRDRPSANDQGADRPQQSAVTSPNVKEGELLNIFSDNGVCDPHVHIFNGKAYLYSTHDRGPWQGNFRMDDWRILSSEDLIHWKLEKVVHPEDTYLGKCEECYATDAAERNGKYYFYFSDQQRSTGVLVSENGPAGNFRDVLGKPLIPQGLEDTPSYDPTVFIDDDENQTPYIIWGYTCYNKNYYIARLNDDMVSLAEEPRPIDIGNSWWSDASWVSKFGNTYYLSTHRSWYATSDNIYGPYTYRGQFLDEPYNDHGTFFTFHNQTYYIYGVPQEYHEEPFDHFFRKTKLIYVHFKDNGDIAIDPLIVEKGVGQYDANWDEIKGEWYFAASDGIMKKENADGFELRGITDGAYLSFQNVNHMQKNALMHLRVSNGSDKPCTVEVREGDPAGTLLGSAAVENTGGFDRFRTVDLPLENTEGTHTLCFVFRSEAKEALRFASFGFEHSLS